MLWETYVDMTMHSYQQCKKCPIPEEGLDCDYDDEYYKNNPDEVCIYYNKDEGKLDETEEENVTYSWLWRLIKDA